MKESEVQKEIIEFLTILERQGKCYLFRNNSFAGFISRTKNGKSVGYVKNNKPGTPDIIMCMDGLFIGMEVKTAKTYQSKVQKEAEKAIKEAGGRYYVVRSLEEVQILVELI